MNDHWQDEVSGEQGHGKDHQYNNSSHTSLTARRYLLLTATLAQQGMGKQTTNASTTHSYDQTTRDPERGKIRKSTCFTKPMKA